MDIVLVIFFLTVQSSYLSNSEADATEGVFDTVQFVATDKGAWRIKTYATDQDVHVWSIEASPKSIVGLARQNTEKHYGDVLSQGYVIKSAAGIEGIRHELKKYGLTSDLEVSELGFLFWVPAGTSYRSRSKPKT